MRKQCNSFDTLQLIILVIFIVKEDSVPPLSGRIAFFFPVLIALDIGVKNITR